MQPVVERELVVEVSREEAWAALTDPARLGAWLGCTVELELRPGGAAAFRFDDGEWRRGRVIHIEPGRELAFTWWPINLTQTPTSVSITIEDARAGATRIRVREAPSAPTRAAA